MNNTIGIVVAPLLLLLIAAVITIIVVIIYMAVYKRNINKALQENNGKHVSLPDAPSVISIILIVVLFFNIFSINSKLNELQDNMDTFRINTEHHISELNDTIDELKASIKNSNSLISYYYYEYENFNADKMTVDVKFEVVLKSFTDKTNVAIGLGEKEVKLEKALSGKYTGTATIGLFDTITEAIALISNDNSTQSENLDDIYLVDTWRDVLPSMKATFDGSPTYKNKQLRIKDDIFISLLNTESHKFTDAYIEIFADGKSSKTVDIDFSEKQTEYEFTLNEKIDVAGSDSEITIYVIAKDSAGLTHKYILFSGNEYGYATYIDGEDLYDKDGKRLTENIFE